MAREEVLRGVAECLAAILEIDVETIKEQDRIIYDLKLDSLDLLDVIFQLEQKFKIKISPRSIERRAKEQLGDKPFEVGGIYTAEGLAELRKAMPEVPPEELAEGLRTSDLPKRFRVGTFVNLVMRMMEEQHA
ncbi:MAG: acyl carrier protein [Deltaproteobacteria bacterium]|jgi:acyl carrier protein|nr:acyl carrier protein [Deltaproteobacteria bacterium]